MDTHDLLLNGRLIILEYLMNERIENTRLEILEARFDICVLNRIFIS
jgi:hypothetical protein